MCKTQVCPDCHEIKSDNPEEKKEHNCDPNIVESVKQIEKDSKPCPKCSSTIYKIDGCNVMFCTICHTAFCWKTGKLETGRIHNPHYYQWLRDNNGGVIQREEEKIETVRSCELLDYRSMRNILYNKFQHLFEYTEFINIVDRYSKIHRLILHIQYDTLVHVYRDVGDENKKNDDLRVKFLLNDIKEEEWKKLLYRRERKEICDKSFRDILSMFCTVGTELINETLNFDKVSLIVNQLIVIDKLIKYINDSLEKVSTKLKVRTPRIIQYEFK